jgi:hypothetical protein
MRFGADFRADAAFRLERLASARTPLRQGLANWSDKAFVIYEG